MVTFKEHAQDGRGIERPAERASVFLSSLAARSRALCASKERQRFGPSAETSENGAWELASCNSNRWFMRSTAR